MRLTEQRLGADIEAGKLARVYLLYGEEDFLIRMYTDKLTELCVPSDLGDVRDMNFVRYSLVPGAEVGSKEDRPPKIDELSDFADSMPFFAERKCVLLRNFDPDALDKAGLEAYLAFIGDIPETSTVIFTRENTEGDPKKYKEKLAHAKMKQIIEAVDKNGIVCELAPFSEARLCKMAAAKAKRAGCELSDENAAFLTECVGGSLSLLQKEVEKLCAYRQSGEITREDIEALVSKRVESNVYALAGELFEGRTGGALEMLRALFVKSTDPIIIMAALSGFFVDLYRAKLGIGARKSYSDAAAAFNYKGRAFVMRSAYERARRISEKRLGDCVAVLYNANRLLNSSKTDSRLVIERAIVEIGEILR